MTRVSRRSAIDQREETEQGAVAMAGARASVASLALMHRVLRATGVRQNVIAEKLGVSEGRVSQIFGGNGNVRVTTLARVLRAAGYRLVLDAVPAVPGVSPLPQQRRRGGHRGGQSLRFVSVTTRDSIDIDRGVGHESVVMLTSSHPQALSLEYNFVQDLETGKIEAKSQRVKVPATGSARSSWESMSNG